MTTSRPGSSGSTEVCPTDKPFGSTACDAMADIREQPQELMTRKDAALMASTACDQFSIPITSQMDPGLVQILPGIFGSDLLDTETGFWTQEYDHSRFRPSQNFAYNSPSPVATNSASSRHTTSSNADQRSAKDYSAGGGARDTIFKELPSSSRFLLSSLSEVGPEVAPKIGFPPFSDDFVIEENSQGTPISDVTYNRLHRLFQRLCLAENEIFDQYSSSVFISHDLVNYCVTKHFECFQTGYLFIHETAFWETPDDALVLAAAAIGSLYLDSEEAIQLSTAFLEFLRRALLVRAEALKGNLDKPACLPFVQASLLSIVGRYHHNTAMHSEAVKAMYCLVEFCRERKLWHNDRGITAMDHVSDWRVWVWQEEQRRTIYYSWLVAEILQTQQQQSPVLDVADIELGLPFSDRLFMASSAEDWSRLHKRVKPNLTLLEVLQGFTSDRCVYFELTELGHTLLVYGLFHLSRQLRKHLWHINRFSDNSATVPLKIVPDQFLPFHDLLRLSSWVEWRNQMCDCLDVLHSHANGTTGHAGGFERPIVLHLHLARIILLSPWKEIQLVACFLCGSEFGQPVQYGNGAMTEAQYAEMLTAIRVWLSRDEYKMRLAVIHSGGIFWHIRRYSTQKFYEPATLFIAALVLWAFCLRNKFLSPLPTDPDTPPEGSTATPHIKPDEDSDGKAVLDSAEIMRIYIDRVLDDELVQTLVLGRDPIEVYMSRVGNLDLPEAPVKLLHEAARLLQLRCSVWPISSVYYRQLKYLANPSREVP
ncbi:C2H2 transcription factor [Fusarium pseudocircinatum]|uniref:C2H2 transcription factor n=1 Tax=Fusarium pseudocircinatum TaxID=56676 RepID=A0A8H5L0K8_9HYPO|nr:C2H2 transcription factor [Fusarium pseudocircinatum]